MNDQMVNSLLDGWRSEVKDLRIRVLTFKKRSYDSSPGLGGLQTSPMIAYEMKKERLDSEEMKRSMKETKETQNVEGEIERKKRKNEWN